MPLFRRCTNGTPRVGGVESSRIDGTFLSWEERGHVSVSHVLRTAHVSVSPPDVIGKISPSPHPLGVFSSALLPLIILSNELALVAPHYCLFGTSFRVLTY